MFGPRRCLLQPSFLRTPYLPSQLFRSPASYGLTGTIRDSSTTELTPTPQSRRISDEAGRDPASIGDRIAFNPERLSQEHSTLFDLFSLSSIPALEEQDPGAKVDEFGQLQITDIAKSLKKYQTALVFSAAPISLVEHDFRRLLCSGKHIEGWRSDGGLEKIIPVRHPQTLRRKHGWILVFSTPAAAQEYQARVHRLRRLLHRHLPVTPESKVQLPPAYTVPEARGFILQDYTISSPSQFPSVTGYLAPFSKHVQDMITLHNNIQARTPNSYAVQVSIDSRQLPTLSTRHIFKLLRGDSETHGVPWKLAEIQDPIIYLTGEITHQILDDEHDGDGLTNTIKNWRVTFGNSSDARRFARLMHRKPLPRFPGLFCDPPPLINVECLFRNEGY
ncbi:hypothetical protein LOZ12_006289 [Ophidiomyces ophidiicola]|uniref:Uncharacterized protein n=1 Tax=Ophidiomyces ophidiicola TaxID=1387563 RepID=A0ACB8UNP7_9EURO|nr:uncharacterized protein LOZ57_003972 [Ophidiomyces ophidiicola]KAI1945722.1 hypothetical protein LOZ57_003972 [Ophidiomyces ophidiicola]KAI1950640.1 hypothetical protein LOZ62_001904 [Ophidiomyces ophidiicola]KAI1972603.1 hypothetical protein LOZ56_002312 [Ophidiomyces ophidiicola]KAI2006645.1 hypothetical protein LOZ50_003031 [Ophidiomyces ophidiicola]KAI2018356.1 hypothetical protein LOZ46_003945 [Ophidiomyces ophidiicola]